MDFSLSEEQSMLADSVGRFIDSDYDFEARQKITAGKSGFSLDMWKTFAELGWTAVPFAEEDGGLGGGPIELMLMMEQFGRGLVVEPFLANVVLAGGALRRTANAAQKSTWLAPLIGGELQAALAFAEPQSPGVAQLLGGGSHSARFDNLSVALGFLVDDIPQSTVLGPRRQGAHLLNGGQLRG